MRNDRDTMDADRDATIDDATSAALRSMLESVRLEGSIFLRAEYTEDWSYESPPAIDLAQLLRPGRQRLVLFHIVAGGRCWVAVGDGERHWADRGDVIVLPYGDQHRMGGTDASDPVPIASLMSPPPWPDLPVIRHGAGGDRTDIVCGYLDTDDPLFDPALRALPPVFVVRPPSTAAAWVEASIGYAMSASQGAADDSFVARRLPELLLTEVLRLHLTTTPAAGPGWLGALRDPVLAPALAHLHRDPARRWTVRELASEAAVSRSSLDDRFRSVLGRSPMRYLREWRMHVAMDLLATTSLTVAAVGRRVGYDAEEAFSRAFKRTVGRSPGHWRQSLTEGPAR
jgi:AraC-like DNA-binding protein